MGYEGFSIVCGCNCSKCGSPLVLEGHSDASGVHYCGYCDDYVRAENSHCAERTEEAIADRQREIDEDEAENDTDE